MAEVSGANSPDTARASSSQVVQCRFTSVSLSRSRAYAATIESTIQVEAAFNLIVREANAIDILVNSVWGGYEHLVENGDFT